MILTDREIASALQNGHIAIQPPPSPDAFSATSVDLTLDENVRIWRPVAVGGVDAQVLSPGNPDFDYHTVLDAMTEAQEIQPAGLIIEPQEFVLAWTRERIDLRTHSRLAARVEGKSSLARLGIAVHVTAPTILAGFQGTIQLEICNHSPLRVKLLAGMRVCQLILETTLGTPDKGYAGMFQGQEAN